mgnify:CR=1 FL=1
MKLFHQGTWQFTNTGLYPDNSEYPTTLFPESPDLTSAWTYGDKYVYPLECIETRSTSEWKIDVELPIEYVDYIEQDVIAVVETKEKGEQPFRIKNIAISETIRFEARHVGYDTHFYAVEYSVAVDGDCATAMTELLTNTVPHDHNFQVSSDIATTGTYSIEKMSLFEAFAYLAESYNGVLDFDGFEIIINSSQGTDRGLVLEYGKNILESEINENWDLVVTRLFPRGNDDIELPQGWLVADIQYDKAYAKFMTFDSDDVSNLELVAQLYLDRYKVPRVNYNVKAFEDDVSLGDTIHVKAKQFDVTTEVISYQYNVITKLMENVEFGNYRPTVRNIVKEFVAEQAKEAVDELILRGIVRFENLTDGVTIIDGGNIKTGTVEGITIVGTTIKTSYEDDRIEITDNFIEAYKAGIKRVSFEHDRMIFLNETKEETGYIIGSDDSLRLISTKDDLNGSLIELSELEATMTHLTEDVTTKVELTNTYSRMYYTTDTVGDTKWVWLQNNKIEILASGASNSSMLELNDNGVVRLRINNVTRTLSVDSNGFVKAT